MESLPASHSKRIALELGKPIFRCLVVNTLQGSFLRARFSYQIIVEVKQSKTKVMKGVPSFHHHCTIKNSTSSTSDSLWMGRGMVMGEFPLRFFVVQPPWEEKKLLGESRSELVPTSPMVWLGPRDGRMAHRISDLLKIFLFKISFNNITKHDFLISFRNSNVKNRLCFLV